jgi:putative ABC transport system ATP-binding protein
MIEIENVSKLYERAAANKVTALCDISLSLAKGQFIAFMGPSGSGKSTLLNLLSGLDHPTTGSIRIDGKRIDNLSDAELARYRAEHIGIVFQSFNLMPVLSSLQNVALPLLLHKMSKRERSERALTALRIVGLEERKDHLPSELSGGEQQRIAIARALISDPDLIVADEPTGDLDARNAEDTLSLLRQLSQTHGKTILMVTHDGRAADYVDRTIYLNKGSLSEPQRLRGAA